MCAEPTEARTEAVPTAKNLIGRSGGVCVVSWRAGGMLSLAADCVRALATRNKREGNVISTNFGCLCVCVCVFGCVRARAPRVCGKR